MAYNLTGLKNATTMYDLVVYANVVTDNILIVLFLWSLWFIMLMRLKAYDFANSILVSSFITFTLGLLMSYVGLVNIIHPLIFLVIAAFTLFYIVFARRGK